MIRNVSYVTVCLLAFVLLRDPLLLRLHWFSRLFESISACLLTRPFHLNPLDPQFLTR